LEATPVIFPLIIMVIQDEFIEYFRWRKSIVCQSQRWNAARS
jgi:hypothetical protein